jgi:hypothetical protein
MEEIHISIVAGNKKSFKFYLEAVFEIIDNFFYLKKLGSGSN